MGSAFYPVFEGRAGRWPTAINGKVLARAADKLSAIANRAKVKTLYDFYSMTRNQAICELLDADPDDPSTFDESAVPVEAWHDPKEGHDTIQTLISYCRANPNDFGHDFELLMSDLVEFERALSEAIALNVRWHLAIDC